MSETDLDNDTQDELEWEVEEKSQNAWARKNQELLKTNEGLKRLKTFV